MNFMFKRSLFALIVFSLIFSGLSFASQAHAAGTVLKADWFNQTITPSSNPVQLAAFQVPQGSEISIRIDLTSTVKPNVVYKITNTSTNKSLPTINLTNFFGQTHGDAYTNRWTNLTKGTYVIEVVNQGNTNVITGGAVYLK